MNLLQKLEAWFAAIWHHFHAGTLPDPPTAGNPATLPPINPGIVTPPAPPVPHPVTTALAGVDTPDANGFVALTGLTAGTHWAGIRFAINEVGQGLPANSRARASVELNCERATSSYNMGAFLPVCHDIVETTDGITGLPSYKIGDNDLLGTIALPFDWTVAKATDHFKAML